MLIAYCLFILWIASLTIWTYQAIVLPSIRQRVRFELFRLRDRTRQLVIEGKLKEKHAAFRNLHSSLNTLIKAVPAFDYSLVSAMQTTDVEVLKRRAEFQRIIEESIPEVREIYQQAVTAMTIMLIFNSLFWFTWKLFSTVPIAIPQGIFMLCTIAFNGIKTRVAPAFELRDEDLEQVALSA
jgi:hypothetical protein